MAYASVARELEHTRSSLPERAASMLSASMVPLLIFCGATAMISPAWGCSSPPTAKAASADERNTASLGST
eukprot:15051537-Alexandrium_andersonii.AAC.1